MHASLAKQHHWFVRVLLGCCGRPDNYLGLSSFRQEIRRVWLRASSGVVRKPRACGGMSSTLRPRASPYRLLGSHGHGRRDEHEAGCPREEPGAGKPHAPMTPGHPMIAFAEEFLDR